MTFAEALTRYNRIAIAGGPKSGKTTLVAPIRAPWSVFHTDAYMKLGWSEASEAVARDINALSRPVIVEGVAVPRALRKGMKVDAVVWLPRAWEPLSVGQTTMTKGCRTVLDEWHVAHPEIPIITVEVPDARAAPAPAT